MSGRDYQKYFDALGLLPGASEAEIAKAKRAYNELYHSDRLAHMSEKARAIAGERIKEVNEAAQALLDPATRSTREAWVRAHLGAYGSRPRPVIEPSLIDLGMITPGRRVETSIHVGLTGSRAGQQPRISWEPPVEWIQVETMAAANQSNPSTTVIVVVQGPSDWHGPGRAQVHFTIEVDGVRGHVDLLADFVPANSHGTIRHIRWLGDLLGRATLVRGALLLALFLVSMGLLASVFLKGEATNRTPPLAARDLGPPEVEARAIPATPTREVTQPKARAVVDSAIVVAADGRWTQPVAVGGAAFRASFFAESDSVVYRVRTNGVNEFVVLPGIAGKRFEGPVRTFAFSSLAGRSFVLKFSRWRDDAPRGEVVHVSTIVAAATASWSSRIWPGRLGVRWEPDRQVAYEVRDARGRLFHMRPGVKAVIVDPIPEWLQFRSIDSLPLVIRVTYLKP